MMCIDDFRFLDLLSTNAFGDDSTFGICPQVFISATLLVAVFLVPALALPQGYQPPALSVDDSGSYEDAKYDFNWKVDAVDYKQNQLNYGQREQRDGSYVKGEYYVLLPDTRLMRVEYYADHTGYHPTYTFEGTAVYPEHQGYNAPPVPATGYRPGK